jgi:WS/DGAT/MGAT family acyltransferase
MWMLEGLNDSRWALLSKVHHCMVDGVSATDLMTVMFDERPAPASEQPWQAVPEPSASQLLLSSLRHQALNPSEYVRGVRAVVRRPRAAVGQASDLLRGMSSSLGLLRPLKRSSLTGPVGPHRTWSTARVDLDSVKAVRAALGGTVNDVVLTLASMGLRQLLVSLHEEVEDRTVRTLVPVSVRRPGERGVYNNRVSAMFAELPVGIADPVAALSAIRSQMDVLKQSKQAVAGDVLTSLSGFAPPLLLALGGRLAARSPSLGVQTGVTNVPGPQQALQTLGRTLLQSYPFVPVIGNIRISIAIFSYNGNLYFGVTSDYDSSSDIDILTAGVETAIRELLDRSGPGPGPASDGALAPEPAARD